MYYPIDMKVEISSISCEGVVVFTSLDGHFAVSDVLTELLETTQKRLLISSPWIGKGFIDLMRRAVPNGISINILTRLPNENFNNSFDAISSLFELAESHRWDVHVHCTSRHHPKFVVIDDISCIAGSLNPTESGIYYNLELGFIITNHSIIRRIVDFFVKMQLMSIDWQKIGQFHGVDVGFYNSTQSMLAEKYVSIFLNNGNEPLPKWKPFNQLKSHGYDEKDIINVENHLLKQGVLYEPRTDWVRLVSPNGQN